MNRFVPLVTFALALGLPAAALGSAAPWAEPLAAACSTRGTVCGVLTARGRLWLSFDNGVHFRSSVLLTPDRAVIGPPVPAENESDQQLPDRDRSRGVTNSQIESVDNVSALRGDAARLAVGPDGSFAAAWNGRLYYGRRDQKAQRLGNADASLGLAIDREGRVWWITRDLLTVFDPTTGRSLEHRLSTAGLRSLAPEAGSSGLLITDDRGIWRLGFDESHRAFIREKILNGPNVVLGIANPRNGSRFYFVRNNYLERLDHSGVSSLAAVPLRCDDLVAGRNKFFLRCGGNWHLVLGRTTQRTEHRAIAVTSGGRLLLVGPTSARLGGDHFAGPGAPWDHRLTQALVIQALARLDAAVGPPPCEPPTRSLAPRVRLYTEISRGARQRFEGSDPSGSLNPSEIVGGLQLSFNIDPILPTRCREELERWRRYQSKTAEKIREYAREWIALHGQPQVRRGLKTAIGHYIAEQKLRALIALYTEDKSIPAQGDGR